MAEEEGAPKLSAIVRPKEVTLKKGKEWGLVLRGTTKLYGSSLELYTCRIDNVTPGGPAEVGTISQISLFVGIPCNMRIFGKWY